MMRRLSLLALAATGFIFPAQAEDNSPYQGMKVDQLYRTLCATCHGQKFEGGVGGSLVDGQWKFGSSASEIFKSIHDGNKQLGMAAFGETLSDQQIRGLVIYLQEKEKEERFKKRTFPKPDPNKVTKTDRLSYRTEIVTEGLNHPWAVAFLPNGQRLVTERGGTLRLIEKDGSLIKDPIANTPQVVAKGQGGLLDVAVHPNHAENGWVYLALSDPHPDDLEKPVKKQRSLTAVYRGRIKDGAWTEQETIWRGPLKDYWTAGHHYGTRMVFQDGYLFFPVGERGGNAKSQDPGLATAKFFRVHDDGRIPKDNPTFEKGPGPKGAWSMGHRNPQGVAIHPQTGLIWSTEHGPRGGDELNLIEPGNNYGWNYVTYGMNYNGTPITDKTTAPGITDPVHFWVPSIAVCGLAFYDGDQFPEWQNDLFVGALKQQEVRRLRLDGNKVTEEEIIFKDFGRIRDVRSAPDGHLYLLTNNPGRLIRLSAAK